MASNFCRAKNIVYYEEKSLEDIAVKHNVSTDYVKEVIGMWYDIICD